ncbi:hypothetical protein NYV26_21405, partial [Escherichia coli]|uniref:hypothetical protein n=3 Tax=Escherichia coli TaxID=562 RepID=UPI002235E15F
LTFQNHTDCPLTDFGGKTSIFSHPVYLFLRKFSLQDSRGGSAFPKRSPHHSNPTRHSIFDHEERQIISVNVSVVTNNNSVLHFFGLRPAHVAIRCHFPDSFLLYGVV